MIRWHLSGKDPEGQPFVAGQRLVQSDLAGTLRLIAEHGADGFYKGTTGVVCKNCAAPINPQSVGMPGGCNPIPLKAETTADAVIIKEADVAAQTRFFQK